MTSSPWSRMACVARLRASLTPVVTMISCLRVVVDAVEAAEMGGDRLAQLRQAVVRGVGGQAVLDGADGGLADAVRRDEVGLADAERDDAVGGGDQLEEAADAGSGDGVELGGYGAASRGTAGRQAWRSIRSPSVNEKYLCNDGSAYVWSPKWLKAGSNVHCSHAAQDLWRLPIVPCTSPADS